MANLLKIAAVNLKHNTLPHFLLAIVIALLTPVIFGISSLSEIESAQPLEMFLSLSGIILLTPIFLPEQNENIRDLIRSKKTVDTAVYIIRLMYSLILLAMLFGIFTFVMYKSESEVTIKHFFGGYISAIFLGALGFTVSGLSESTTNGYMVSFIYYIASFILKERLNKWYLFSMSIGSFDEKYYLFITSFIMIFAAMYIRNRNNILK